MFCTVLIISLLLGSAIYAEGRGGNRGGAAQSRGAEKTSSAESRATSAQRSSPVTSPRQENIQQRQSATPRNNIRTETPPPVSRPAATQPGNSRPTVQYSKPQSSTTSLDRRSRIVSGNPAVSVSRTKDTPSVNVSPSVSQIRNAPGKSATVADRDRISQPAQKALPQGKADRIGSVIGQTTMIDKGIARSGKDKAERQVARETDIRSITGGKTADLAREALTRRDKVNRETPQKTVMPTLHTDSQKAGSTLERERPGNRTEKVFKSNVREKTTIIDKNIVEKRTGYRGDRASRTIVYHDRPRDIRHTNHYDYIYRDSRNNFRHIAVWPQYYFWVNYSCGSSWNFTYVHPFYHRKYIFISLGGWWPEYSCVRYYWYNYHPFEWYGFYPVPQEVYGGNTYNYYTYNYYNTTDNDSAAASYAVPDQIPPVDHTTFADVRAKMQQQAESTPDAATKADEYFDEAVKAFEINCFNLAADKFAEAMKLAPDDMILPFAYSQSLLALERYTEAADVLRTALVKVTPDKEGVFYPRGLYADEDVLTNHIDLLSEKAKLYSYDADLQLLLGYQMLGLGELDEAEGPLTIASQDIKNAPAANVLLNLLAKMRARVQDSNDIQPNSQ